MDGHIHSPIEQAGAQGRSKNTSTTQLRQGAGEHVALSFDGDGL